LHAPRRNGVRASAERRARRVDVDSAPLQANLHFFGEALTIYAISLNFLLKWLSSKCFKARFAAMATILTFCTSVGFLFLNEKQYKVLRGCLKSSANSKFTECGIGVIQLTGAGTPLTERGALYVRLESDDVCPFDHRRRS